MEDPNAQARDLELSRTPSLGNYTLFAGREFWQLVGRGVEYDAQVIVESR